MSIGVLFLGLGLWALFLAVGAYLGDRYDEREDARRRNHPR